MANRKLELVKAMHSIVQAMNNEDAYFNWIYLMPDEPTEEDFMGFATNEDDFNDLTRSFFRLCKIYGKDGFYCG